MFTYPFAPDLACPFKAKSNFGNISFLDLVAFPKLA